MDQALSGPEFLRAACNTTTTTERKMIDPHFDGDVSAGGIASANDRLKAVIPLVASANRRWDRKALANAHENSPEVVNRKVKSLLNKLSMPTFDSVSDQIISWANKSENEKNCQTLYQVISLVFEKATDEAAFSEMYARLCRKMMEQISSKVQDECIKNQEGKPIAGGQLFRKCLLNRCQDDFERGWVAKENAAAAAAAKKGEDDAAKAENEMKQDADGNTNGNEEIALYSDEYYLAQKAKRQGLGLIKFIGELFKLQMLTERTMHECVKKLLGNVDNHEEGGIESLCKLLTTVGQMLDTPKAKTFMDVYFSRMKELRDSSTIHLRIRLMLQNILELRERKWLPRNLTVIAPPAVAVVHEQAADDTEKQPHPGESHTMSISRSTSLCGDEHPESIIDNNRWPVAGQSKCGSTASRKKNSKRNREKRPPPSTPSDSVTQTSSQKLESVTEPSAPADGPVRRKLVLAPRSKPIGPPPVTSDEDEPNATDSTAVEVPTISDTNAMRMVDDNVKTFFALRSLAGADHYFHQLPATYHHILVNKLVSRAIESTQADAELVGRLFKQVYEKNLVEIKALEEGFTSTLQVLPDVAIDPPKAYDLMTTMMKGVDFDEGTRMRPTLETQKGSECSLVCSSSLPECGKPALGSTLEPLEVIDDKDGGPPAQDFHLESSDGGTVSEVLATRILVWALYSETDKDVQSLLQLSKDIRDAAVESPASSAAHARMCRVLVDNIHPCVQDAAVVDNDGVVLAGGELFRKQLRDSCDHALLRMFPAEQIIAQLDTSSAATHFEVPIRRSKIGLARFVAELLKVEVFSRQDVHRYIRIMLAAMNKSYDDDGLESLCVLLNHSGKLLECSRIGSTLVSDYLLGIRELVAKASSSRAQFVLQHTTELRRQGWSM